MKGTLLMELLLAFAIYTLLTTALLLLMGSGREGSTYVKVHEQTREYAQAALNKAIAESILDFGTIVSTTTEHSSLTIADISPCLKEAASTGFISNHSGTTTTTLVTSISSSKEAEEEGGDCATNTVKTPEHLGKEYSIQLPFEITALDALTSTLYLASAQSPYLAILTNGLVPIHFENNFVLPYKANAIDAFSVSDKSLHTRETFVVAALASTTNQFALIKVTDPKNPQLVALYPLRQVDPKGSFPEGWLIHYYGGRVYETTRETSGNEFHTFDLQDPEHPHELGTGVKLGITFNAFSVANKTVSGKLRRFLYAATSQSIGEIGVYDATDEHNAGALSEILSLRKDLPGAQNAISIALLGRQLYVGRQSVPGGPDFYIYDITNTPQSLSLLGSADIGSSVSEIEETKNIAFMAALKSGQEMQIWNTTPAATPTQISTFSSKDLVSFDFDGNKLFIATKSGLVQEFAEK